MAATEIHQEATMIAATTTTVHPARLTTTVTMSPRKMTQKPETKRVVQAAARPSVFAYPKKGRTPASSADSTGMHPAATASKIRRLDSVSPLGQKQNLRSNPRKACGCSARRPLRSGFKRTAKRLPQGESFGSPRSNCTKRRFVLFMVQFVYRIPAPLLTTVWYTLGEKKASKGAC